MTTSDKDARFALWVLFGINLLNFFDRTLGSALVEPIRREFGLTDQQVGLASTTFVVAYAIVGLPLGRLADTRDRTRLSAIGVAFWSVLTAFGGAVWSYGSMLTARVGVGLGEAVCAPAGQSLIGDYFPAHRRSRALALFMAGLPIGIFCAYLFAGAVAARFGWRAVMFAACVPGLVMAGLALRMREPARGATEATTGAQVAVTRTPFRDLARIRTLWWIVASGATYNFHAYATNSFNTAFLMRFHGLDLRQAGQASSISLGLVGLIGLFIGGTLGDRLRAWRPNGRLLLAASGFLVAAPCAYLALRQPAGQVLPYVGLMSVMTASSYIYYATVYSALQDVVEPRLRGASVALYFFAMYLLGAAFGPVIVGTLSDWLAAAAMHAAGATAMSDAFRAAGLHRAMYVIPVVLLVTAFVLLAAARTVGPDMERMQARFKASFR
ncbi:MAG: MFS transporter [Gemmatimonadaceae bacterium]|nr:MFS transporter [Gemmatimonadaceae bacterium]